jgi:hypothetical protein
LNELESLGVSPKARNELNDIQEISNLAENLKQIFYQAYKEAYSHNDLIHWAPQRKFGNYLQVDEQIL